jgi:Ca-activated chloride channel family protein
MNGLTFAEPAWFYGAAALLLPLALRIRAQLRATRRLPGLVSPRLAARLVGGGNEARRWTVFSLRALALVAVLAALARPQLGFEEIEAEVESRNLLLAIDTSRSMLADDVPPNRLERTKLAAKDIVLSLPDDRVGVIAFAGAGFLQAPLTNDHEAVLETIDQLDTDTIPRGGTNLGAPVAIALETIRETKAGSSALVLFSDGEAHEGLDEIETMRERATREGLAILAVGVGTPEGSIIPETDDAGRSIPGVFVKDEQGQIVRTRLVTEGLRALAADGAYVLLGGGSSLSRSVEQILKGLDVSREGAESLRRPIERFLWPLSLALALLCLSHVVPLLWPVGVGRAGSRIRPARVAASVSAALFLLALAGSASGGDVLQPGHEAYERGDFAEALEAHQRQFSRRLGARDRARLHLGVGAAAYRLGDYERAAEAFGSALVEGGARERAEALHNLGNTLYKRGEVALQGGAAPGSAPVTAGDVAAAWESAIEHFESALAADPANAFAEHNLEYVRKRLEELKEQQEEQNQEQQQGDQQEQDEKDQDKNDQEKQDQEKQDQGKQDQQGQPGDSSDGKGDPDPSEKPEESDPSDPSDPSEEPNQPDPSKGEEGQQSPPSPDPSQAPPPQPEAPDEGKLEANPGEPREPSAEGQPREADLDRLANPETGYAPTEARQLLEALADETEVRPILPKPPKSERFKNW